MTNYLHSIDPARPREARFGCPLPTSQTGDGHCSKRGLKDECSPEGTGQQCEGASRCCQTKCGKFECLTGKLNIIQHGI